MKLAALSLLSLPRSSEAVLGRWHAEQRLEARDGGSVSSQSMAELYPYYHSTEDLRKELRRLAKSCPGFALQAMPAGDDPAREIDVVTIRKPGASPVNKNFLLFGEHSRELISPESGLHFIKSLCGETSLAQEAQKILEDSEFQIVVNGNPGSRRKVEGGQFCLRVNPAGVDLNRNWDEHWSSSTPVSPQDTYPGPKPFSEPETRVFKSLVESYKPSTFLTIHSGTKGMYMPWAYDMEHLADRNQPEMLQLLQDLDSKRCQCPFGAAGREVGYSCPGTCLDWVYNNMKCQYAFAFEIYIGLGQDQELRRRWEEKVATLNHSSSPLQTRSHLAGGHFKDVFREHPSNFVQVRGEEEEGQWPMPAAQCFALFNPTNEAEYAKVIENWSKAYLEMSAMVVANMKGKGNSTAHSVKV